MKKISIEEVNHLNKNTMMEQLGIEYTVVEEGYMEAKMPVDRRTYQPYGILHGGASIALAETLASFGSALMVDTDSFHVKGQNVTANHIRSVSHGWVYGEAKIVHKGRTTHLWNVDILNEEEKLVSTCRLTIFIVPKQS